MRFWDSNTALYWRLVTGWFLRQQYDFILTPPKQGKVSDKRDTMPRRMTWPDGKQEIKFVRKETWSADNHNFRLIFSLCRRQLLMSVVHCCWSNICKTHVPQGITVALNGHRSGGQAGYFFLLCWTKFVPRWWTYDETMELSHELSLGQCGFLSESSAKFSEVGRCNRIYDSSSSHCFLLQELFDNFDYHSRVDILKNSEKTVGSDSHLEVILRCFERSSGWFFESFLSCFAVQVSITLLQLAYSWSSASYFGLERFICRRYVSGTVEKNTI